MDRRAVRRPMGISDYQLEDLYRHFENVGFGSMKTFEKEFRALAKLLEEGEKVEEYLS